MPLDIPRHRLHNQFLFQTTFNEPGQVLKSLGAVQSQDYGGAKWALGLRMIDATDAAIERSFDEGAFLRTHILRPTWHFVAPEDIRWMLALSAPRVHAANAFMYRQLELDQAVFRKSYQVLEKALQGGKQLTRSELGSVFEKAGILAEGPRLGYLMMSAELDGIICSGLRRGKQFTYALLEERAPKAKALEGEEALAELTRRYFATRGPATLQDFTWWSGLTVADAKEGIEAVKAHFVSEVINGKSYWFDPSISPFRDKSPSAHLLPNYDEYFVGFRDRSAVGEVAKRAGIKGDDPSFLANVIILDGQLVGRWRRTLKKNSVLIEVRLIVDLTPTQQRIVDRAAHQYGEFLQLPVERVKP